jgi:catechol 2,3-dioxygenase-like lactoylglutathione lyase family enzyme
MKNPNTRVPTFGRAAPTISVPDIDNALEFYVGVLGFLKTFANGDPVGFVILQKDAAEIHLTKNPEHRATVHNVAHLLVDDAKSLYDHLAANGVRIIKGLRDADYDMRGFVMADPDGNRIDVGQNL